jgi:hypothetical protein
VTSAELDESACGYCRRPWFGLVAYCPYCGRKPSFEALSQEPDDRPQSDEPLASERRTWRIAPTLVVKTVVAGVSALLLFWMVVRLPGPNTNDSASIQLPTSNAAQVPSVPLRTESAVSPPSPKTRSLCSAASEAAGLCRE